MKPLNFLLIAAVGLSVAACTRYQATSILLSKDPKQALKNAVINRPDIYKRNPMQLARDIENVRKNFNSLIGFLKGEAGKEWGNDDVVIANRTHYVKYTQNYKSRAIINFDNGEIIVESVVNDKNEDFLRNAIITTLLTPDDPRAVDLFSDKTAQLSGTPFLYKLVTDHNNRFVYTPEQAEEFSDVLLRDHVQNRTNNNNKHIRYVTLNMVKNHNDVRAMRYKDIVERYSKQFGISKSLVFAVIKTESNFNPFAVSNAPAYGLMQLVPTSGGRDAYMYVKGEDRTPDSHYLFNAENNIELGAAYLNIINSDYLKNIRHPISREYCTIAAYNTGSGNVLRTFSSNREKAVDIINTLDPVQTYKRLRQELNSAEARRYLEKVTQARKEFINI